MEIVIYKIAPTIKQLLILYCDMINGKPPFLVHRKISPQRFAKGLRRVYSFAETYAVRELLSERIPQSLIPFFNVRFKRRSGNFPVAVNFAYPENHLKNRSIKKNFPSYLIYSIEFI